MEQILFLFNNYLFIFFFKAYKLIIHMLLNNLFGCKKSMLLREIVV